MGKRLGLLALAAVVAALVPTAALAKSAILLPGGTYLNQAATTGLACFGGSQTSTGTTTFIVAVGNGQSGQNVTFKVDYSFEPDDPALPTYSGGTTVQAHAASSTTPAVVPITIPVTADDGSSATVVNTSVLSVTSDATLLFDAANVGAWACASQPSAAGTGSGSQAAACSQAAPLYASLIAATSGAEDLQHKVIESQRECDRGHLKQARHKIDEFVKKAGKQGDRLGQSLVSGWIEQALAIRGLLV